ncbi:HAD family hydrolase [Maribellus sp. YY47]|uniref:HAD-IIB family hydrolase n=1 Tax=Maribellus sp. YY47 TaxID=2929486 RepID=UPI002001C033|nr:HAD family hydrolase [Maribellus sp. YY47]MCK3685439.1 Cof-type HAD-IIB family hydrolase [Maribellus sp. YY47]
MKNIKLVATDLDGTFLRNDRTISESNLEALRRLGERQIIRVAATGRNLNKVKEVLTDDIPFDYVVFSSGAGIYQWNKKEHLFAQNLSRNSSEKLLRHFVSRKLNFHAFYPVPENHNHYFFRGEEECEEFERYFNFNQYYATELDPEQLPQTELCQFLVIIKEDEDDFRKLKTEIEGLCPEIRVIRSSSPITPGYIWIEVFHHLVSKGNGVREVCRLSGVEVDETMGIGNDYNDFDLLEFTRHSFLTYNSPKAIQHKYPLMPSNEEDAFAVSVQPLLV